uniref:Dixin n=1 Tax=Tetraodon nigroviridis TaxID=99883 RepID=H3CXA8_TETNG
MIASLSRGNLLDEVLHGGLGEQQLVAYVSWVNSQLKRKPGLKAVRDLRHDLQDGVVLVQLIEIVAGEVLQGVYAAPQNKEESRKNVEQVLRFISSRRIRMPHISARDIVDGNLKSVMRIILALAAHFKPSANHRAASGKARSLSRGAGSHEPLSPVALAQGAAAALASARHDASQPARSTGYPSWGLDAEKSVCVRALVQQYEKRSPDEQAHVHSGRVEGGVYQGSQTGGKPVNLPSVSLESQRCQSAVVSTNAGQQTGGPPASGETALEDALCQTLEKEVEDTRKMVSALQALLLHGSLPEEEQDVALCLDQGEADQQATVLRSRLDQSMEEARELKRELLRCKQEMRNLQGIKDAQQQRLCTQEASILQMKQDLLRASMTKDDLVNKNAELQWKMEEYNRLWGDCKKEIEQKERLLQQLKYKLEEKQIAQVEWPGPAQSLSIRLINKRVLVWGWVFCQGTENNGYSHSGSPPSSLSDFIFTVESAGVTGAESVRGTEEVQLLRDGLRSLRNNFRDHDPQQHTLDTLEQGIVSLIERLHVLHARRVPNRLGRGKSPRRKTQHADSNNWPSTSKLISNILPPSGSPASTKILYFTGKSPTPSMISIHKRLGEVTLKDVKAAVDREGNYRYHFKALDPEFGTVKEEVFLDGAIIPGWEGKIVAWLEEDRGDD